MELRSANVSGHLSTSIEPQLRRCSRSRRWTLIECFQMAPTSWIWRIEILRTNNHSKLSRRRKETPQEMLDQLSCRDSKGSKVIDSRDSPQQKQHLCKCKIIDLNRKEYMAINFIQAETLKVNNKISEIHIITSCRIERRTINQTLIQQKENSCPEKAIQQIWTANRLDPTLKDLVVPEATSRNNKNETWEWIPIEHHRSIASTTW